MRKGEAGKGVEAVSGSHVGEMSTVLPQPVRDSVRERVCERETEIVNEGVRK